MAQRRRWRAFADPDVASAFARYPEPVRLRLMQLRELIFETARATDGVGPIEEALRWGEPSYLTPETGSGSTLRLGSKDPDSYGLYVHCQTDLIARFRSLYPDDFDYEGKRCVRLRTRAALPRAKLKRCIALALTYHLDRRRRA